MSFCYLLYRFRVCSVLLLLLSFDIIFTTFLSPLIAFVTINFSFESFALYHTTFTLLLETILFSKNHAISAYILSHLDDFGSSMSLHKYYLVLTTFLDSSFMKTNSACPNDGTPASRETFNIHSSLIHVVIRYICIGYFIYRGKWILVCTTTSVFIETLFLGGLPTKVVLLSTRYDYSPLDAYPVFQGHGVINIIIIS